MIDVKLWMKQYQQLVLALFGERVLFIGLQGSYGRNEATSQSDLDVVLILDQINIADLKRYKQALDKLPQRQLICGFVAGKSELVNWSKFDLFQFYYDTIDYYGKLGNLISQPTQAESRQAVLVGACNIYHQTSHNFLHAASEEMLKALYKAAYFVLQAKYYSETGIYLHQHTAALSKVLNGLDLAVWQQGEALKKASEVDLEAFSKLLLEWTSKLIEQNN